MRAFSGNAGAKKEKEEKEIENAYLARCLCPLVKRSREVETSEMIACISCERVGQRVVTKEGSLKSRKIWHTFIYSTFRQENWAFFEFSKLRAIL